MLQLVNNNKPISRSHRVDVAELTQEPTSELGTIDKGALGDLVEQQLQSEGVECVIRERVDNDS